ncbi:MAG: hypothetical protein J4215_05230 [Candidatus Diapherotrites archaeon]|uniref:Uncharacterized protein n=1 Tax=Candidatus Iainarchaeum sp. TaxID=3101447 RepID=A0A8T4LGD6_9ARCH|nr:hypothetical protein [Candidatus Diapherotrites archaeon]
MVSNEQILQGKAIKELAEEAARVKEGLKGYLEDLELYSNPEFWEAIAETNENKGKKFASTKKLFQELDS